MGTRTANGPQLDAPSDVLTPAGACGASAGSLWGGSTNVLAERPVAGSVVPTAAGSANGLPDNTPGVGPAVGVTVALVPVYGQGWRGVSSATGHGAAEALLACIVQPRTPATATALSTGGRT